MNDWATGRLYTTTGLSRERHVTRLPSQSGDAETKVLINAATQLPIFRRTKLFALRPIFPSPIQQRTSVVRHRHDRRIPGSASFSSPGLDGPRARQVMVIALHHWTGRERPGDARDGWDTSFLSHFPPTVCYRHGRDWWCSVYQPCGMISSAGMDMPIFAKTDLWLSCVTPALLQLCQDTSAPANDSPHCHDK